MTRRTSRAAFIALTGLLLLGGCGGALLNQYYSLPASPELLISSEFYGDWNWRLGAESGYPYYDDDGPSNFTLRVRDGFAIAREHRQFVQYENRLYGDLEIRIAWQRWVSDAYPAPFMDNEDDFNFRIILDSDRVQDSFSYLPNGPVVELKLGPVGAPDFDELRVREGPSVSSEASLASVPSPALDTRRGELVVIVRPSASPPTISARVFDDSGVEILSVARDMAEPVPSEPYLTVQMSGIWNEARVIDSILAMRAR